MSSFENDYSCLLDTLASLKLADWQAPLTALLQGKLFPGKHGDLPRWYDALNSLPDIRPSSINLNTDAVRIGTPADCDTTNCQQLYHALQELHPWRKGPFDLFGIYIDTEWHSDWKWQRVSQHIADLTDRNVLDVGCGNGYYAWRMLGAGARRAIGIDPTLVFVMQYLAIKQYLSEQPVHVLPAGIDDLPVVAETFDSVFSMGVLYHRREPLEHLHTLKKYLREDGELVLETLVIDGKHGDILKPGKRYARMPNVWQIPAVSTLEDWLKQTRFKHIRCVDISVTTSDEQRRTEWMRFESLDNCLDPQNPSLTVEGYPAPIRAVFIAER